MNIPGTSPDLNQPLLQSLGRDGQRPTQDIEADDDDASWSRLTLDDEENAQTNNRLLASLSPDLSSFNPATQLQGRGKMAKVASLLGPRDNERAGPERVGRLLGSDIARRPSALALSGEGIRRPEKVKPDARWARVLQKVSNVFQGGHAQSTTGKAWRRTAAFLAGALGIAAVACAASGVASPAAPFLLYASYSLAGISAAGGMADAVVEYETDKSSGLEGNKRKLAWKIASNLAYAALVFAPLVKPVGHLMSVAYAAMGKELGKVPLPRFSKWKIASGEFWKRSFWRSKNFTLPTHQLGAKGGKIAAKTGVMLAVPGGKGTADGRIEAAHPARVDASSNPEVGVTSTSRWITVPMALLKRASPTYWVGTPPLPKRPRCVGGDGLPSPDVVSKRDLKDLPEAQLDELFDEHHRAALATSRFTSAQVGDARRHGLKERIGEMESGQFSLGFVHLLDEGLRLATKPDSLQGRTQLDDRIADLEQRIEQLRTRGATGKLKDSEWLELANQEETCTVYKELRSGLEVDSQNRLVYRHPSWRANAGKLVANLLDHPGFRKALALYQALDPYWKDRLAGDGAFADSATGFRGALVLDTRKNQLLTVFAGSAEGPSTEFNAVGKTRWVSNIQVAVGDVPRDYEQASVLTAEAMRIKGAAFQTGAQFPAELEVRATGFSKGAGMATYAAIDRGVKASAFDPAPLGVDAQIVLGDKLKHAGRLVTAFTSCKDWVAGRAAYGAFHALWKRALRLKKPTAYGTFYAFPGGEHGTAGYYMAHPALAEAYLNEHRKSPRTPPPAPQGQQQPISTLDEHAWLQALTKANDKTRQDAENVRWPRSKRKPTPFAQKSNVLDLSESRLTEEPGTPPPPYRDSLSVRSEASMASGDGRYSRDDGKEHDDSRSD